MKIEQVATPESIVNPNGKIESGVYSLEAGEACYLAFPGHNGESIVIDGNIKLSDLKQIIKLIEDHKNE